MDAKTKDVLLAQSWSTDQADRDAFAVTLREAAVGTVFTDTHLLLNHVNATFCDLTGQGADALVGCSLVDLLAAVACDGDTMAKPVADITDSWYREVSLLTDSGHIPVQLTMAPIADAAGGTKGYVGTFTDMRGRKQAEQWNRMLLDVIKDLSRETDLDALGEKAVAAAVSLTGADIGVVPLLDANNGLIVQRWGVGFAGSMFADGGDRFPRTEGLTGLVIETGATQLVQDYPSFERALPEHVQAGFKSVLMVPIRSGRDVVGTLAVVSKSSGHEFGHAHIPILEAIAEQLGVAIHRQRLVEHLVTSEARLRKVVRTVPNILFVLDPNSFSPTLVSPAIEGLLGFTPEEIIADPAVWRQQLHVDDRDEVLSALSSSLQTGDDLAVEGRFWHKNGETCRWFSIRAATERDIQGHSSGLIGVLTDITDHKRAEEVERASMARQQETLVNTIDCLVRAMEKRDPYTSGHQYRVAQLAVAIAEYMGLDAERIEGIRLGALIHDVGKIYVPAEILNRPGSLTDAEFALIKSHAEVGLEIVEGVDFPWPVGQMIGQHHERLDGSGYPDGLSGEAIALEARVLAVADVVEAMTSHRPYRPSLGMDAALEELVRNRGTRYDPRVTDACLQLIQEKGFRFEPHGD